MARRCTFLIKSEESSIDMIAALFHYCSAQGGKARLLVWSMLSPKTNALCICEGGGSL